MLRFRQVQQAEERAQKAGAKMRVPMLLFGFPGSFFVILGPGYFQYQKALKKQQPFPAVSGPNETKPVLAPRRP